MYTIEYAVSAIDELGDLKARERKIILDKIDEQLSHEPTRETRNKKILRGLIPPWEYVPPVWELRVGEYRAYYDVNEEASSVTVRAVRHKPPHRSTKEIL